MSGMSPVQSDNCGSPEKCTLPNTIQCIWHECVSWQKKAIAAEQENERLKREITAAKAIETELTESCVHLHQVLGKSQAEVRRVREALPPILALLDKAREVDAVKMRGDILYEFEGCQLRVSDLCRLENALSGSVVEESTVIKNPSIAEIEKAMTDGHNIDLTPAGEMKVSNVPVGSLDDVLASDLLRRAKPFLEVLITIEDAELIVEPPHKSLTNEMYEELTDLIKEIDGGKPTPRKPPFEIRNKPFGKKP